MKGLRCDLVVWKTEPLWAAGLTVGVAGGTAKFGEPRWIMGRRSACQHRRLVVWGEGRRRQRRPVWRSGSAAWNVVHLKKTVYDGKYCRLKKISRRKVTVGTRMYIFHHICYNQWDLGILLCISIYSFCQCVKLAVKIGTITLPTREEWPRCGRFVLL